MFPDEDLNDDFILQCRAKRIKTLKLRRGVELRLQEASVDELVEQFRAVKHMLIPPARS